MQPTFSKSSILKTFRPKKKPELELDIYLVTEENSVEIAYECAKIFMDFEPLCLAMEVDLNTLVKYVHLPILQKSIKDGLAIVAYNRENNEFVSTIWSEDPIEQDPIDESNPPNTLEPIYFMEYLENLAFKQITIPETKGEAVHVVIIGTNPKYSNLGIMQELQEFQINEQDISKTAKLFFTEATNDYSIRMFEKCNFKTLISCKYDDLPNDQKFKKIQNSNKKFEEKGFSHGKKCNFMILEKNNI